MDGEMAVAEVLGTVPPQYRNDFVFHATDVFGGDKYKDSGWSITDRLFLLKSMMSIPRRLGMAVTVAAHWRGAIEYPSTGPLSMSQFEHMQAFALCISMADRSIRKYAGHREVATIVAEDVPEMRRFLRRVPAMFRDGVHLPPSHLRQTPADLEAGYSVQAGTMQISRIRKSIHFVEKADDPIVQVADACAFGIRRFLAGERFGEEFVAAILGDVSALRNFGAPAGAECFWPAPTSRSDPNTPA